MSQLIYLANDEYRLSVEGNHLRLHKSEQRLAPSIPLDDINQVVLAGACSLDSLSLRKLCKQGIAVLLLDSRHPVASAYCIGEFGGNLPRRWQQHQWLTNEAGQLRFVQALLGQRLREQRHLLQKGMSERPALRLPLFQACKQLTERLEMLKHQTSLDSLRGVEGAASASFFSGYQQLFAPSLEFHKRVRRPPTDPVNSLLSLGYTLLLSECIRMLITLGFDPWLGCLHRPAYNRPSLACDLQELGRGKVEYLVWQLFRNRELTTHHFSKQENGCCLNKEGAAFFFRNWAGFRKPLASYLEHCMSRYLRLSGAESSRQYTEEEENHATL